MHTYDKYKGVIYTSYDERKYQLPSFSESELLSELEPLLDPELLLLELPLVVLLSDRRDDFGSELASKI